MKALVGAFNQEKALVGAFSVIVQPVVEPMERFTALVIITTDGCLYNCHVSSPAAVRGLAVVPARGQVGGEELHVKEVVLDIT